MNSIAGCFVVLRFHANRCWNPFDNNWRRRNVEFASESNANVCDVRTAGMSESNWSSRCERVRKNTIYSVEVFAFVEIFDANFVFFFFVFFGFRLSFSHSLCCWPIQFSALARARLLCRAAAFENKTNSRCHSAIAAAPMPCHPDSAHTKMHWAQTIIVIVSFVQFPIFFFSLSFCDRPLHRNPVVSVKSRKFAADMDPMGNEYTFCRILGWCTEIYSIVCP